VASPLGRRRHFSPSAREQRGLSPEIQQSCGYTNCSLNISLQPSRDNVVDQARISYSRLDWLTVYPNASNRKFKPSKCKKDLWPYPSLPPWLVLSPCSSLPAAVPPCECEAAARLHSFHTRMNIDYGDDPKVRRKSVKMILHRCFCPGVRTGLFGRAAQRTDFGASMRVAADCDLNHKGE
jgi:hypothetical protein